MFTSMVPIQSFLIMLDDISSTEKKDILKDIRSEDMAKYDFDHQGNITIRPVLSRIIKPSSNKSFMEKIILLEDLLEEELYRRKDESKIP